MRVSSPCRPMETGIAYTVRRAPADLNQEGRFRAGQPFEFTNAAGTPNSVIGTKIGLTHLKTRRTVQVGPGPGVTAWRPSWSTDASKLAYYSDAGGAPQLWVHDVQSGRDRKLADARIKAMPFPGDEAQWSPDDRTLYVALMPEPAAPWTRVDVSDAASEGGVTVTVLRAGSENTPNASRSETGNGPVAEPGLFERLYGASVAAVDMESGAVRILAASQAEYRPGAALLSPDGKWLAYFSVPRWNAESPTASQPVMDLAVGPSSGGSIRTITTNLPVPATRSGRINQDCCNWHPHRSTLFYVSHDRLWAVDFDASGPGAPRQLAPELAALTSLGAWFTKDGRAVLMGLNPQENKRNFAGGGTNSITALVLVSLEGDPVVPLPFDQRRWTLQRVLRANERTLWQPDGRSVFIQVMDNSTRRVAVVRVEPGGTAGLPVWSAAASVSHLTGDAQHRFVFGTYEDFVTAPDVFRWSGDFSRRERISTIEPRVTGLDTGRTATFSTQVPLHDGQLATVQTAVILPPGAQTRERLPVVVLVYPGADVSASLWHFGGGAPVTIPTQVFSRAGFAVLLPDLPMGPGNEAGNYIQEMTDVLMPQLHHAASLGYADSGRAAIVGQSGGGYLAAAVVSQTQLFRAAIAINGFFDLAGERYSGIFEGTTPGVAWSENAARMGAHPWANILRYIDNSPYYRADRIHTPLLIVQGSEDMSLPQAQMLFTALRRLDRPVQLAVYAGQGHVVSSWMRSDAVDATRRMLEFLQRRLN